MQLQLQVETRSGAFVERCPRALVQADVWRWYETPSAYGQGIGVQSGGRGPNMAYFIPHLSGLQLLAAPPPSQPAGRSPVVYHTPAPPGVPGQVRVCSTCDLLMLCHCRTARGKARGCAADKAGSVLLPCTCKHQLCFWSCVTS